MAPERLHDLDTDELKQLAARIAEYQEARSLTFTALLKRYPGIGSDRTFGKIVKGDTADLDIEKQLANYRAVVSIIEAIGDEESRGEELYDDLGPVVALRRALIEAMREGGNARLVLVEGDTGMGKTSARRLLAEKFGQRLLTVEASVAWNDSPIAMLGSILSALGVKNPPVNQMLRLEMVVERLTNRVCILIEEAHHMGPKCLNLIKTLINMTPGEFVLLAMPTLWRKLEGRAFEEVRQLVGNRLAERIKLKTLREVDVRRFVERRVPGLSSGDSARAVKLLMPHAASKGNLGFVREVCKRAVDLGDSLDLEQFAAAVSAELESR